ncbi:glycosyltransferase family 2 protein [Patescibacteria group bacterium]|nr:glycosyltransferase family 2 protein [Patescibacteria group bacterium]
MKLSFILPLYNEAENLPHLFDSIHAVIKEHGYDYELIAVDDGSRDASFSVLKEAAKKDPKIKVIRFLVNSGQTAALSAGIEHATGDVLIPLDSDLENDPKDIPVLLAKLDEGYDVVSGWRKDRWKGKFLTRKVPSVTANWLISKITGVHLHDYGCTLKAYRAEVIRGVKLYGEMHRFIPAYASWRGARVTEVPVRYHQRIHGKSNYGISRTFKVLLDLLLIKFLHKYMDRPMHFFGGLGLVSLALGLLAGLVAIVLKIFAIRQLVSTPLPQLSALFIIVGVQLAAMGVIAEMIMRMYYETQDKRPYSVKETINLE